MSPDHVTAAENRETGRRLALPAAREVQVRILRFLHEHGPATDEAISQTLHLKVSTVRRRRAELVRAGVVVRDGECHWKAVPPLPDMARREVAR